MNKLNVQIIDVTFQCVGCETSVTKMCHSDNLGSMMLLCYNCHYARLSQKRKASK